jgi:hydrogenase maturation protease
MAALGAGDAPLVRVVGLGNVLMGDDALGPWVIHYLAASYEFPDTVSLVDAGTPGLDLTPFLSGVPAIVLVDTVSSNGDPGELRLYRHEQLLKLAPQPRLSPHDPGVTETLQILELEGGGPSELLLVGVIPGPVQTGVGLSSAVRDAVPVAAELVLLELVRLGVAVGRRVDPWPEPPWWEVVPELPPVGDERRARSGTSASVSSRATSTHLIV